MAAPRGGRRGADDGRLRDGAAPLRILLYAPHFAEYTLRLADALSRQARVLLIVENRNLAAECPPALVARVASRIELATFDGAAGFPAGPLTRQMRLPWIIRRFRPMIAHVQEQADAPTAAMLTGLSRRMPVVLTVHDPRPHSGSDTAYAERGRVFRERLRDGAAAFHVHGAFCERELRASRRIDRPVISTPAAVLFVPTPDAVRPREPGTILFFGRMEAYKGLETLLDAADRLRARGRTFRVIVAGRGPELGRLAGRLAGRTDIEVHDAFLRHDEAIALFQRSSLVVAPYRDATQSGVVASAFGNGRPVVASRVGGLPDAIADGRDGILVPPDDPGALADALEPLLCDDRKIEALMAGVRARAEGDCDWGQIAARLETFYRSVLAGRPAPGADYSAQPQAEAQSR